MAGKKERTTDNDVYFMQKALALARKAYTHNEVPVGAIVVSPDGTILGRGYNQIEKRKVQTAHAEIQASNKACKKWGDWRLDGCQLYVTLEPCTMCMGLVRLSRIKRLIFGVHSKLFGYQLDKRGIHPLYKEDVVQVAEGICSQEAAQILKDFFKQRRKEKGWQEQNNVQIMKKNWQK